LPESSPASARSSSSPRLRPREPRPSSRRSRSPTVGRGQSPHHEHKRRYWPCRGRRPYRGDDTSEGGSRCARRVIPSRRTRPCGGPFERAGRYAPGRLVLRGGTNPQSFFSRLEDGRETGWARRDAEELAHCRLPELHDLVLQAVGIRGAEACIDRVKAAAQIVDRRRDLEVGVSDAREDLAGL